MSITSPHHSDGRAEPLAAETLADAFELQALLHPARCAFRIIDVAGSSETLSFHEMHRQVQSLATWLAMNTSTGDRVLLPTANESAFLQAFLACASVGCVAVPIQVPRIKPKLPDLGLGRFLAVIEDCAASLTLIDASGLSVLQSAPEYAGVAVRFGAHAIQGLLHTPVNEALLAARRPAPESLALLQYTSGSTSHPKGVMLTQQALMENQRMIQQGYGITPDSTLVSWLPLYHDMGLCNGLLQGIASGAMTVLMPPIAFITQPLRWLQEISLHRNVVSGAPNFAYAHCAARIPEEDLSALDLSSWQVAFCGAEPIHPDTLRRFTQRFSQCGFRESVFCPSYGLAEATLFVCAERGPVFTVFSGPALAQGVARPPAQGEAGVELAACGSAMPASRLCIADPVSSRILPGSEVGEICVASRSAGSGYWKQPAISAAVFGQKFAQWPGYSFLRTGDLGFLYEEKLYVAGRVKEMIIINGVNHYPQDIEYCAQQIDPALQVLKAAAFSISNAGGEKVVLLMEVPAGFNAKARQMLRMNVMMQLRQAQDLVLSDLVLVKPGSIPRTSSGKVQRLMCRKLYEGGVLVNEQEAALECEEATT